MFEVAVTTCARPGGVSYLARTMESLKQHAGFDEVCVYYDGQPSDEDSERVCTITQEPFFYSCVRQGIVPVFRRAVASLVLGGPPPDYAIIFQDDILASKNLRFWLEENPPPQGVSMLYCSSQRSGDFGWNKIDLKTDGRMHLGACGVCMDTEAAMKFLDSPPPARTDRLGFQLAEFCYQHRLPMHFHCPSLIQHIGKVSVRGELPTREAGEWIQDARELG